MKYEMNYKRLRDIRHRQEKTLEDVSKDLHVSVSRFSKYEHGKVDMDVDFVMKLCNYYGVSILSVVDVIYDEGEEKIRNPERIPKILSQLELYWYRHPDYRLFQLLNAIGFDSKKDNFYVEDDKVLSQLCFMNGVKDCE